MKPKTIYYDKQGKISEKTIQKTDEKTKQKKKPEPQYHHPDAQQQNNQQNNFLPTNKTSLVTPAAQIKDIVNNMNLFNELKTKLLNENDIMYIGKDGKPTTKEQGKPYIKKSGWRKLSLAFNLNCEILHKEKQTTKNNGDNYYKWIYYVRVTAPNGRVQESEGIATSKDKFFTKGGLQKADEANIMMKAQTVAFNRAVSDLIGGGEVSAEEIQGGN